MPVEISKKRLGAFYTSSRAAQLLVDWAVRSSEDRVLDPSCGEGVFLSAAASRLSALEARPRELIYGIEIDPKAYARSIAPLLSHTLISKKNVLISDFFDVSPSSLPKFDAVVGNPPFIRYQTFKGQSRDKALAIAKTVGVAISELASSWAPFVVHATEFLKHGGRLAMVVPAEIAHAAYARPVVRYLAEHFERVCLASFTNRLFPELNQDAYLIFADGFGKRSTEFRLGRFNGIEDVATLFESGKEFGTSIDAERLQSTNGRLRSHFLPTEATTLYNRLAADPRICRLGEVARIGIGYVTGCNEFFHLTEAEARRSRIPRKFLKPCLMRSGLIKGLRFTKKDWAQQRDAGEKVYLLALPKFPEAELPDQVREYLAVGKRHNVHRAYKCLVRDPWYSVPHSSAPQAFLSYMSGGSPKVTWNAAQVLATNSSHEVRLKKAAESGPWKIALSFCSSFSQMSGEIEGHPLGGGMLKLEPSEAERTLIVRPEIIRIKKDRLEHIDSLIRSHSLDSAADLADELILNQTLGVGWDQIQILRTGLHDIRETRRKRASA